MPLYIRLAIVTVKHNKKALEYDKKGSHNHVHYKVMNED